MFSNAAQVPHGSFFQLDLNIPGGKRKPRRNSVTRQAIYLIPHCTTTPTMQQRFGPKFTPLTAQKATGQSLVCSGWFSPLVFFAFYQGIQK